MTKICTTIEQSKKLIELWVDVNTADMTYVSMKDYGENTYHLTVGKTDVNWAKDELGNLNWNDVYEKYIPAWSLSALLELTPKEADIHKDSIENEIFYSCGTYGYASPCYNNPIDAIFSMVVWLKENGKI